MFILLLLHIPEEFRVENGTCLPIRYKKINDKNIWLTNANETRKL